MDEQENEYEPSEAEKDIMRRTTLPDESPQAGRTSATGSGFLARLFGGKRSTSAGDESAKSGSESVSNDRFSKGIDLSQGTLEGKQLFKTGQVRKGLKAQLRGAGVKDAETRKAVQDMILGKRAHGLNKKEVKKGLRDMRKEGTISRVQERNIRRDLGIKKNPGLF